MNCWYCKGYCSEEWDLECRHCETTHSDMIHRQIRQDFEEILARVNSKLRETFRKIKIN